MKAFALVFIVFFISNSAISQASTKGNWSDIEKQTVIDELSASRESFETFLDSAQVDTMILCLADKIEANFENMDEMDGNSEDIERMTFSCLGEMGLLTEAEIDANISQQGKWSADDITYAYENLEYTRNIMTDVVDSNQIDPLFDCVVAKLEMTYESFAAASNDAQNVSVLTYECLDELQIFKNDSGSSKGNWSEEDVALLEEDLTALYADIELQSGKSGADLVTKCIREKFVNAFESYADINNHPEIYRTMLDECYGLIK